MTTRTTFSWILFLNLNFTVLLPEVEQAWCCALDKRHNLLRAREMCSYVVEKYFGQLH